MSPGRSSIPRPAWRRYGGVMKTWLITGTSTGFGRIMTEKLIARGDRVAATVRDGQALAAIQSDRLWTAELDLTDLSAIRAVVDRAFADLGTIDVVVSNAGYGLMGAAEEASDAQMLHVIQTNLLGSMQLVRSALPHLRAQEHGRLRPPPSARAPRSTGRACAWRSGGLPAPASTRGAPRARARPRGAGAAPRPRRRRRGPPASAAPRRPRPWRSARAARRHDTRGAKGERGGDAPAQGTSTRPWSGAATSGSDGFRPPPRPPAPRPRRGGPRPILVDPPTAGSLAPSPGSRVLSFRPRPCARVTRGLHLFVTALGGSTHGFRREPAISRAPRRWPAGCLAPPRTVTRTRPSSPTRGGSGSKARRS